MFYLSQNTHCAHVLLRVVEKMDTLNVAASRVSLRILFYVLRHNMLKINLSLALMFAKQKDWLSVVSGCIWQHSCNNH